MRAAGLPVELEVTGLDEALPAGLDLSAYRIVQESLTNVLKHAGRVPVAGRRTARAGRARPVGAQRAGPDRERARPAHVGHGLIGMRERIALYGGDLTAGPTR